MQLLRYIHLNPYKTTSPDFVGPQGWKWSSHKFYTGKEAYPDGCRDPQELLEAAERYFGVSHLELTGPAQRREVSQVRKAIA
jgi:hypothetical protein